MSVWDTYPTDYRATEVGALQTAVRAGECAALLGLSGAGKSNVLGFMAHRLHWPNHRFVLVDFNRLPERTPEAICQLMARCVDTEAATGSSGLATLEQNLARYFATSNATLCFLVDMAGLALGDAESDIFNNWRALRDLHKYQLTLITATRHALPPHNEFAELVAGQTLWLGPLSASDARWTIRRYATRKQLQWGAGEEDFLLALTAGYPAFLRAACEAVAAGASLDAAVIYQHPAVQTRLAEFWADSPTSAELQACGLQGHPWLFSMPRLPSVSSPPPPPFDRARLTAKEERLLDYLQAHPQQVCAKDDLIRAVWPEDQVFERGVRDDSLAQIVRRVREKIEPDASHPRYLLTVPGRGYRFNPPPAANEFAI